MEFDVSGVGNGQLARAHSTNTLATFTFDATNDDVQVVAPVTVASAPSIITPQRGVRSIPVR